MKKYLLIVLLVLLAGRAPLSAQALLQCDVKFQQVLFDRAAQAYTPMPFRVTFTIHNVGTSASTPLSARILLTPNLSLDTSEHSTMIKTPLPTAAVPAGDSCKVQWLLTHPPSFKLLSYRVYVWLKSSATDSSQYFSTFTLPAMENPVMNITMLPIAPPSVRSDSLAYDGNPFAVQARLANAGYTTADSVKMFLQLPMDFVLDPPTQNNPILLPTPLAPSVRYDAVWTVRYTAARRPPRSDSVTVTATAINIIHETVTGKASESFIIPGLAPAYTITLEAPDALQYDAVNIYSPDPFTLKVKVKNISEQNGGLRNLNLSLGGIGVTTSDPMTRPLGLFLPGEERSFQWNLHAARGLSPRTLTCTAVVSDSDNVRRENSKEIQIPGKPVSIDYVDVQAPAALQLNADSTGYLDNTIPVSFRLHNGAWHGIAFPSITTACAGDGVNDPNFHPNARAQMLPADETTDVYNETFSVAKRVADRSLTLRFFALDQYDDTGSTTRSVFVPGVKPVVAFLQYGVDSLTYDPVASYYPNPFPHHFVALNTGDVTFTMDSVIMSYSGEGIMPNQPALRIIGRTLVPGDSVAAQWDFTAYRRDVPRIVTLEAHWYYSGKYEGNISGTVFLPALYEGIEARITGDDSLQYNAAKTYDKNPFSKTLHIRNNGTMNLSIDSVIVSYTDPLILPLSELHRTVLQTLLPGDSLELPWSFSALKRDTAAVTSFSIAIHHRNGVIPMMTSVRIPGRTTAFQLVNMSVPTQLALDATDTVYVPNPFITRFRAFNDDWEPATFASSHITITGSGITPLTLLDRSLNIAVAPAAASDEIVDSFFVRPSSVEQVLTMFIQISNSTGKTDTASYFIYVPRTKIPAAYSLSDPESVRFESIFPNPASSNVVNISFTVSKPGSVTFTVFDALGKQVAAMHESASSAGRRQLQWNHAGIPGGEYFLRMTAEGRSVTKRFVLVK